MRHATVERLALAASLLTGCTPSRSAGCPLATTRDAVYPLTGTWQDPTDRSALLCLVQSDVETVTGRASGAPVAGTIRPDGTVILATAPDGDPRLAFAHRLADTLTFDRILTPDGAVASKPARFLRVVSR